MDARRLCSQAFEKYKLVFQRARIGFVATLPPGCVLVMADAPYLQRLLNIVLENAVKYTPAGGKVELILETSFDVARFEVTDSGIGIPLDGPSAHL